ncbi:hypothetical protein FNV43_RR11016 [Rhamnella rubrinervis]|uniref:Uncharacterized protein n=1 Tax=Rhamnella rubrinervis TaxID=2594499 RepID=A0A8K0H568_9ROSA|nr:hypothetical protein FNV43_RR11016 [Rhamnella rubrinervis]
MRLALQRNYASIDRRVKWLRGGDRNSKFFHSLRVRKFLALSDESQRRISQIRWDHSSSRIVDENSNLTGRPFGEVRRCSTWTARCPHMASGSFFRTSGTLFIPMYGCGEILLSFGAIHPPKFKFYGASSESAGGLVDKLRPIMLGNFLSREVWFYQILLVDRSILTSKKDLALINGVPEVTLVVPRGSQVVAKILADFESRSGHSLYLSRFPFKGSPTAILRPIRSILERLASKGFFEVSYSGYSNFLRPDLLWLNRPRLLGKLNPLIILLRPRLPGAFYLTISGRRFGSWGSPVVRFGLTTGGMPIIDCVLNRKVAILMGGPMRVWPIHSAIQEISIFTFLRRASAGFVVRNRNSFSSLLDLPYAAIWDCLGLPSDRLLLPIGGRYVREGYGGPIKHSCLQSLDYAYCTMHNPLVIFDPREFRGSGDASLLFIPVVWSPLGWLKLNGILPTFMCGRSKVRPLLGEKPWVLSQLIGQAPQEAVEPPVGPRGGRETPAPIEALDPSDGPASSGGTLKGGKLDGPVDEDPRAEENSSGRWTVRSSRMDWGTADTGKTRSDDPWRQVDPEIEKWTPVKLLQIAEENSSRAPE